jgi:hypothetical protein
MKKFLAVYIGTAAARGKGGWESMSEAKRQEKQKAGTLAWGQWVETHKAAIVDTGAPLGKTKRISGQGIADIKNAMVAYAIVQADSHQAAARLFEKHPHFMIFPGDSVEVMECLPIPRV